MLLGNQTGTNYGFSAAAANPYVSPSSLGNNYVATQAPAAQQAPVAQIPAAQQAPVRRNPFSKASIASSSNNVGQLTTTPGGTYVGFGLYQPVPVATQAPVAQAQAENDYSSSIFADPFSTAMSGNEKFSLQPYINRMTQNASNALYGGFLNYKPQSMVAGNAGGTPINSTVPNWHLPSAIPTPNQGQVGLIGSQANQQPQGIFGNRAWMEY
jgi:hypothetical protein